MSDYNMIAVFKALADDARLRIIEMLASGELCACDILEEFAFSQPTLSYHMKILTESGLALARKDGVWIRYTLNVQLVAHLEQYFAHIQKNHIFTGGKNGN